MNKLRDNKCEFLELAPKEVCKDTQHMEKVFQDIIDKGGEGVILRDPSAPYRSGRSRSYLKHKVGLLYHPRICSWGIKILVLRNLGTLRRRWWPVSITSSMSANCESARILISIIINFLYLPSNILGRMVWDLLQLRGQANLRSAGVRKKVTWSASNIRVSSSRRRSRRILWFID